MRRLPLIALPTLLACQDKIVPGTSAYGTGESVQCDDLGPGDRLDIEYGCADGVCADVHTYGEVVELRGGEPQHCDPYEIEILGEPDINAIDCQWSGGFAAIFEDDGDDGEVSDDDGARYLRLTELWDGSGPDGLGVNLPVRCFIEVYGEPDYIYEGDDPEYPKHAFWAAAGFSVSDYYDNGTDDYEQDGLVEDLVLY